MNSENENIANQTTECSCGTERYTWEQCPNCRRYGE
jgi:hypothetical protein